jgi:DHA2 family multidrug resistance protein
MTNLLRNWGGSFGIAFVTTESVRRQSFHQSNLVSHLDSGSQALQEAGRALTGYLMQHGFTRADAGGEGLGRHLSADRRAEPVSRVYGLWTASG